MPTSDSTCWTVIRAAASGSPAERDEVARRYQGVVRGYLAARWGRSPLRDHVDDAAQEVFVECFRRGGVLDVAASGRVPRFRAFLYGVVRNVARRFESQPAHPADLPRDVEAEDLSLSRAFDQAWARAIMAEAARLHRQRANDLGGEAARRVELLRLRFEEGLPIRTIAEQWGVPAASLHHAYARARQEFQAVLLEVVSFHSPGPPGDVAREASELLGLLS